MVNLPVRWPVFGMVATSAVLVAPWLPYWLVVVAAMALLAWAVQRWLSRNPLAQVKQLVEQSLVGVYFVDRQLRLAYGNPALADILGYTSEQMHKLSLQDLVHPEDAERTGISIRKRLSGEVQQARYGFRMVRGDGAIRHVEVYSHRVMVNGQPMVAGVLLDITEQYELQAELALYAKVFESSSEGILVTDAKGVVLAANPAILARTGFQRQELVGESLIEIEARAGNEEFARSIGRAAKSGAWRGEIRALRSDGTRYPVRMSLNAVAEEGCDPTHFVAVLHDLSEVKHAEQALLDSERKFRAFVELSLAGLYVVQEGRLVYANPKLAEIHGYPDATSMVGLSVDTLTAPEDLAILKENHRKRLSGEVDSVHYVYRARKMDGSYVWLEAHGRMFQYEGKPAVIGIALDVSHRVESERQSRLAARVFESAGEGILITNAEHCIVGVNPAFTRITGYEESEAVGKISRMLSGQGARGAEARDMIEHLHRDGHWQGEMRDRRKSGEWYPVWLSISAVRDDDGRISNYVGVFTDYTTRKETESRLHYLAHHDDLTGLLNRGSLMTHLDSAIRRVQAHSARLAVLFLDLDRFKAVNDTLGHEAGDQLLMAATERLRFHVKDKDVIARLGGDEFTVMLEDIAGPEVAGEVAGRIVESMAQPFVINGHEMFVTASVGVAMCPSDGVDAQTLLKNADVAMYRAKERGKNTYQFFDKDMNAQAFEHLLLENSLWHALEREEFELHYQPQVNTADGNITGVEALLRWRHPDFGLVMPGRFISLAEQTGLIVPIGAWVLREACQQAREWINAGYTLGHVAVNLSARQFADGGLLSTIQGVLESTGLPPQVLELEITESTIMRNPAEAAQLLDDLRNMGVAVSVDDFGTGYSSLVSLKHYPLDCLKIDRGFIEGIPVDADDVAITEAVIAIARKMRLKVVAEGVETQEQFDFLRSSGCDRVQGYLMGSPVPAEDISARLAASRAYATH
ncbi:MAG: PAS domain S-box protein [Burkholderiales bacterium]|nr:PAS domain S-box protein [Burkholderiales bacterium]